MRSLIQEGEELRPLNIYEDGTEAWLHFTFEKMGPAFAELEGRAELCARTNEAEGVELPHDKRYPAIGFSKLSNDGARATVLKAMDWMLGQIRSDGE